MPATDLGWPLNENTPIFHVYGTKRKCSSLQQDHTETVEDTAKRRCLDTSDMDSGTFANETQPVIVPDHCLSRQTGPEEAKQLYSAHYQQHMCSPAQCHNDILSAHHTQLENNNNIPSLQPPVFHTQSLHMESHSASQGSMNVPGITASGDSIARWHGDLSQGQTDSVVGQRGDDLSGAVANMEAEDTPSPTQQEFGFCDTSSLCGGGDISPRSHRVRCYCMPSWEGQMDDRHFMSDYY